MTESEGATHAEKRHPKLTHISSATAVAAHTVSLWRRQQHCRHGRVKGWGRHCSKHDHNQKEAHG